MPVVTSDIDYEANGKQISSLVVDHNCEGFESPLRIPISVIKNGAGPTLFLNGGTHGDEFEGPVVLTKLIRALEPSELQGRLIVTPALNLPALLAGTRCSPIDGLDLNRSFPGEEGGSITTSIAGYVGREVLPRVDAVFDLHAGGNAFSVIPSVMMHPLDDTRLMAQTVAALRACKAPASVIAVEPDRQAMLDSVVENSGKVFICAELGSGGCITPETVRIAETILYNVLKYYKLIPGNLETPSWRGSIYEELLEVPDSDWYLRAEASGLYEPIADLAEELRPGCRIGQIHSITDVDKDPLLIIAPHAGILFCQRASGLITAGEAACIVARSWESAR